MATVKHIKVRNTNYTSAIQYLKYQHNEFTNKPIYDELGKMLIRDDYLIDGINCSPDTFGRECLETNRSFGKNNTYDEVKAHHYIISFDPDDRDQNGLTMGKAQDIGIEIAKKIFPGYQTIVCTHPDGHNGAGNIHCHIVINSIRKLSVDKHPFSERDYDFVAGAKHRSTDIFTNYLKQTVMDICNRENLYQIDLLSPAKVRITDKEYWAQRKGQVALDKENAELAANGITSTQTKFETEKGFLRTAITTVMKDSHSLDEFQKKLLALYGIEVHESRGRFSYLTPDRNKPITGRKLGTDFEKQFIEIYIQQSVEKAVVLPEIGLDRFIGKVKSDEQIKSSSRNAYQERQSFNENLLTKSQTIAFMQENGLKTIEDIQKIKQATEDDVYLKQKAVKDVEAQINKLKKQKRVTGQYFATKKIYQQFLKSKNKEKFRQEHDSDLRIYESSRKILNEEFGGQDLMQIKQIDAEITRLEQQIKPPLLEDLSIARKFRYKIQIHESNFMEIQKENSLGKDNQTIR